MDDKRMLYVTMVNITITICLTILALVFEKWWIVLFVILIHFNYEYKPDDDYKKDEEKDK